MSEPSERQAKSDLSNMISRAEVIRMLDDFRAGVDRAESELRAKVSEIRRATQQLRDGTLNRWHAANRIDKILEEIVREKS